MKRKATQKLPPGWTAERVRAVIDHYDNQTDDEAAAEIEAAEDAPLPRFSGETWMSVPTKLVGAVHRLIKEHEKRGLRTGLRNAKNKPAGKRPKKNAGHVGTTV
jgi:hypothetical protein